MRRHRSRKNSRRNRRSRRNHRTRRNRLDEYGQPGIAQDAHLRQFEEPDIPAMDHSGQRALANRVILEAENDGRSYRSGDAEGAVEKAFQNEKERMMRDLNDWFRQNKRALARELNW